MPNAIKYNVSAQTLALKKGNFWIGTGDVEKGPTETTDYWNGITPPAGGYTIYQNKVSQGPSIYVAENDSELISYTNHITAGSYTEVTDCLAYFFEQSDKMITNIDYPSIITNGLVYCLDAGFTPSYPRSGNTWTDLSQNYPLTLFNNPSFENTNNGLFTFDGIDDYGNATYNNAPNVDLNLTINCWVSGGSSPMTGVIIEKGTNFYLQLLEAIGTWSLSTGFGSIRQNKTVTYTANTWINITVVMRRSAPNTWISFFVNGVRLGSEEPKGGRVTSDTLDLNVGRGVNPLTSVYYNGVLSQIQIYNRVLSTTEVLQNYNAQKSRYGL